MQHGPTLALNGSLIGLISPHRAISGRDWDITRSIRFCNSDSHSLSYPREAVRTGSGVIDRGDSEAGPGRPLEFQISAVRRRPQPEKCLPDRF